MQTNREAAYFDVRLFCEPSDIDRACRGGERKEEKREGEGSVAMLARPERDRQNAPRAELKPLSIQCFFTFGAAASSSCCCCCWSCSSVDASLLSASCCRRCTVLLEAVAALEGGYDWSDRPMTRLATAAAVPSASPSIPQLFLSLSIVLQRRRVEFKALPFPFACPRASTLRNEHRRGWSLSVGALVCGCGLRLLERG